MPGKADTPPSAPRQSPNGPAPLAERLEASREALSACTLCERRCGANRLASQAAPCHLASDTYCLKRYVSMVEDIDLVPTLRVYFAGCNLRCHFCNTAPNGFDGKAGVLVNSTELAREMALCVSRGARSIDILGGEPSLHPHTILGIATAATEPLPLVLDTNLYMSLNTLDLLDGTVCMYLANIKYGNNGCARTLAGVDNYVETIVRNLGVLAAKGSVRLRYLLLPGHQDCCLRPFVERLARHLPRITFHLMTSYVPCWQAVSDPVLGRVNTPRELAAAQECLAASGLTWRTDSHGPG